MNILKDKFEAYVVSTMEDNQRVSLLDNFAISVEKAIEEADLNSQKKQGKVVKDGKVSEDFCYCLYAILDHELKEKFSFWNIAELLSPKETVQMIYRLNFKQSDKTRSEAWIHHSLNEGSMGSYFSLLIEEESGILKKFYKSSAFVRDKPKMESAQNLLNFAISSIQFIINIEKILCKDDLLALDTSFDVTRTKQDQIRRKPRGHAPTIITFTEPDSFTGPDSHSDSNIDANHKENNIDDKQHSTFYYETICLDEKLTNMTFETKSNGIVTDNTSNSFDLLINEAHDNSSQAISEKLNQTTKKLNEKSNDVDYCTDQNSKITKKDEISVLALSNKKSGETIISELTPYQVNQCIVPTSTLIPSEGSAFCPVTKLKKSSLDINDFSLPSEGFCTETCIENSLLSNFLKQEDVLDSEIGFENSNSSINIDNTVTTIHSSHIRANSLECNKPSLENYYVPGIHINENDIGSPNEIKSEKLSEVPSIETKSEKLSRVSSCSSIEPSSKKTSENFVSRYAKAISKSIEQKSLFTDSESDTCSWSDKSFSILAELGIIDSFIGLKEDYFTPPEDFMGFSSQEELQNAITECKVLIKNTPEHSEKRKVLVTQLIQLRLKKQELEEQASIEVLPHTKKVLGHQLQKQPHLSLKVECDVCASIIWLLLQTAYICNDCGFHCHKTCLRNIDKPCISNLKLSETTYQMEICPEKGLSSQRYRCADCLHRIALKDGVFLSRICDYTGLHYCHRCHWNDLLPIPARILHNWDFTPKQVSRKSKFILLSMLRKAVIKIENVNPYLIDFIEELQDVHTLRHKVLLMKEYIATCRIGINLSLLLNFQNRQHFMDNPLTYSVQDLIDVENNILLEELTKKCATLAKHIKFDCPLCQGKGFVCEYCRVDEIIYPFDNHVTVCSCKGTFHRLCYSKNTCPRCARMVKKKQVSNHFSAVT
ncbi:uncharacterized protein LOC100215572 isoform X1 [Hydra vulgaris]|uniref:uncharacterized protein LOC100215572 isoform X1 n=2 Tax=Hydra vulgaris TaxID=6087 RepID=UPI001F5F20AD|nr:uncharacterized protein LOC100215572 isoform X1 [Hydra vulgaris]